MQGVSIEDIKKAAEEGGFIYIKRSKYLTDLIDSGLMVPVNDYINGIQSLSAINDVVFRNFTDENENIWAIPLSDTVASSYRLYNGNWIKKWGKGIPKTTVDFLEYAEYIKHDDPDGNGMDDSYILSFSEDSILSELSDIFQAFGCYCYYGMPVAYNPKKEMFENVLLNENIEEALAYIKNMYDEGYLYLSEMYFHERENDPNNFATAHMQGYSALMGCDDIMAGFYLAGTNDTKLIKQGTGSECLLVLEGTSNVEEKVEYLINKILNSRECSMDLDCGIKNESYFEAEDYYVNIFYKDMSIQKRYPKIGIDTYFKINTENEKPVISKSTEDEMTEEKSLNQKLVWKALEGEDEIYKDTDLVFTISSLLDSNALDILNREIYKLTNKVLQDIILDSEPIEETLENYYAQMKSLGILSKIDDLNNLLTR